VIEECEGTFAGSFTVYLQPAPGDRDDSRAGLYTYLELIKRHCSTSSNWNAVD